MSKAIFLIYIVIGIATALYAASTKTLKIPFEYEHEFTTTELTTAIIPILIGLFFFVLGYGWKKQKNHATQSSPPQFRVSKKILLAAAVVQLIILLHFLGQAWIGYSEMSLYMFEKNYRPLGGKTSTALLLIQAALPIIGWRKPTLRIFFLASAFLVAFLFAWIDASRSSIIPLSATILFLLVRGKKPLALFLILAELFFFLMAMTGRSVAARIDSESLINIISITSSNPIDSISELISYTFSFSIFQFAYVTRYQLGEFGWADLFYSAIPVPSFFWGEIPDYSRWRVDIYRPMGALSELIRVSSLAFYAFFFVFGKISRRIDEIKSSPIKIISGCVFFLICVMIFQYNLRSVTWFFILIATLLYLDHKMTTLHRS